MDFHAVSEPAPAGKARMPNSTPGPGTLGPDRTIWSAARHRPHGSLL